MANEGLADAFGQLAQDQRYRRHAGAATVQAPEEEDEKDADDGR